MRDQVGGTPKGSICALLFVFNAPTRLPFYLFSVIGCCCYLSSKATFSCSLFFFWCLSFVTHSWVPLNTLHASTLDPSSSAVKLTSYTLPAIIVLCIYSHSTFISIHLSIAFTFTLTSFHSFIALLHTSYLTQHIPTYPTWPTTKRVEQNATLHK